MSLTRVLAGGLVAPLMGCAMQPTVQWAPPPQEYLADCPVPSFPIKTNGDLARLAAERKTALEVCNADKAALRAWASKGTK